MLSKIAMIQGSFEEKKKKKNERYMEILLLKLCPKIIKAITNTGSILLVL
jgi:hypothetical protein